MSKKEPGYWRGYTWGLLTVPIIGTILTLIGTAVSVIAVKATVDPNPDGD